ncbi:MAG: 50S ribosomal protein L34e [Candidatus Woesearchaeota archaeon]
MPAPRFRSRTFRRVAKKLPSGKVKIHYEKRKNALPKCAICKKELKGIPKTTNTDLKKLAKSEKSVERKYGGYLCSKCAREKIKAEVRV